MATGSILEIITQIISQIFFDTIVSALRGVFRGRVMSQAKAHHQDIIDVERLSKEKFIELDLANDCNVLTVL